MQRIFFQIHVIDNVADWTMSIIISSYPKTACILHHHWLDEMMTIFCHPTCTCSHHVHPGSRSAQHHPLCATDDNTLSTSEGKVPLIIINNLLDPQDIWNQ